MKTRVLSLGLALALAACGGGGGSGSSALPSSSSAGTGGGGGTVTATPTSAPSTTPNNPTPQATSAVGAAPSSITASGALRSLSWLRFVQAATVPNTIPKVVWSYSANPNWGSLYGQLVTWAYNTTTSATLPQASLNATAASASIISVQNAATDKPPTFYGLANDWVVTYNSPTSTGATSTNIVFADAASNQTIGSVPVNVYDTWYTGCPNTSPIPPLGNLYRSGAPVAASLGSGDVQIDCTGLNLQFPLGAILASQPVADSTGNVVTTITRITAAVGALPSALTSFPISGLKVGQVYVCNTQDGGFAKFEVLVATASGNSSTVSGISWHAKPDGSYAM